VEIPIDEIALEKFAPTQRVNAVFTKQLLNKIDEYRQSKGLNRSKLLSEAVNEYMGNHP
jgi:metal-responsive CopG/Arc/MetJ family transcriptional regulator